MKKRAILVMVAVLMVSVLAFSLCACGDKDKNDKGGENAGVNFEGMSKEDIVKMADEGKITSFTYMEQGKGEYSNSYYCYAYSELGFALLGYDNDGTLTSENYNIENDDEYYYAIYCHYYDYRNRNFYDEPEIDYFKGERSYEFNVSESFKETIIDCNYTIDGDKLVLEENENHITYIYKVNATDWTVPEKFSKYKELAVEE